ncbi:MAG: hypothetical protein AB7U34_08360 [Novosphingobium sp.]
MKIIAKSSLLLAGLCLTASAAIPAHAYDPIVLDRGWSRVAHDVSGSCEAEVGSNGQFYIIAIYGMAPYEQGRYFLTNGDMKPIDWRVKANGDGAFSRYYIPFRWSQRGGSVNVDFTSESCNIALAFDWARTAP